MRGFGGKGLPGTLLAAILGDFGASRGCASDRWLSAAPRPCARPQQDPQPPGRAC